MNVLEKIVLDKREEVEQRKSTFPLTEFEAQLAPSDRDFKQALIDDAAQKGASYILECKKASPSKGLIREKFDLDEICQAYGQYASCVSVLTDEKYFQGDFARIEQVKQRLSQPVLCKDFMVDTYQVALARHHGANAILLMLSVLNDEEYVALQVEAEKYGLSILTEVSNEEEMHRAVKLKADILGINNRNLRDLSTDLNQTPILVNLFNELADEQQQQNTVLISESGVYTHQQVKLLSKHVRGFLVGSSLMAQTDLEQACKDLVKGEVKVCGMDNADNAKAAVDAGAKYLGCIFVEQSPRNIELPAALAIKEQVPQAKYVAVVKDKPLAELKHIVTELQPAAVQLHGNEDQDYIDQLAELKNSQSFEIWKAIPVSASLPERWPNVDKLILDTQTVKGESGGAGVAFDWSVFEQLNLDFPTCYVAGGLNLDNVSEAKTLPVSGLDVNSGVENSDVKGQKSAEKIKQFLSAAFN